MHNELGHQAAQSQLGGRRRSVEDMPSVPRPPSLVLLPDGGKGRTLKLPGHNETTLHCSELSLHDESSI